MRKRLWDLAKSRIEIATILPGHRHKVLFTARADGSSASPAPQDFCKACLWQVVDASIDLRDPNMN